jgi:hypothetical protein
MVTVIYKNGQEYSFELKNREREMDFCIDCSRAEKCGESIKYKVTNKFGIVRIINSADVLSCQYSKTKYVKSQMV